MHLPSLIQRNKSRILPHLCEWAETFIGEIDDEGEPTLEPYDIVFSLAEHLENNHCSERDYEEIRFHIDQINYNETKIRLT